MSDDNDALSAGVSYAAGDKNDDELSVDVYYAAGGKNDDSGALLDDGALPHKGSRKASITAATGYELYSLQTTLTTLGNCSRKMT
jgi:hypothetical protein